ncbi:exodeoxyribonuclease VII large subunit [Candidatus Nomurabacteria bacterium]|nr:exodeoxyribonuclease VII large subunit [Candidatus Nomurabacteria bacterium]
MTVITVSQLNRYVAALFDSDRNLSNISVSGEISSLKRYQSGHIYFNLKDNECSVSCVMFRSKAVLSGVLAEDGLKVIATGRASLYDRDGKFQLYINEIKSDGKGDLYAAFEELKRKLEKEGLFDASKKRKIPYLPRKIGVASSPSGAVIRDIINVLTRRFPGFDLQLIPVKVQGDGAADSIIKALKIFNNRKEADVIIIARGGGSMEDLWCFNDERLARAIAASEIPVISAIGHETDFTICDFAADLRAPTPSAAAELAVPNRTDITELLFSSKNSMNLSLTRKLEYSKLRLQNILVSSIISKPEIIWKERKELISNHTDRITSSVERKLNDFKKRLDLATGALESLNPVKVIRRGYAIVRNNNSGKQMNSIADALVGDKLTIKLFDGNIICTTDSTEINTGVNDGRF